MRAPGAPVGFLLFFVVLVNMYSFGGISREEEFQKSMRKKRKDTYVVSSAVFVGSAIL